MSVYLVDLMISMPWLTIEICWDHGFHHHHHHHNPSIQYKYLNWLNDSQFNLCSARLFWSCRHGSSSELSPSSSTMLSTISVLVLTTLAPSLAVRDQRSLVNTFPFNAQDGVHDHQHGAHQGDHHDHGHHQAASVSLDNRGARQVTGSIIFYSNKTNR